MGEIECMETEDYYLIPALVMEEPRRARENPETRIGRYGQMRLRHLRESDGFQYTLLVTRGEMKKHLIETETAALSYVESFMEKSLGEDPIPEELKDSDPPAWIGRMENLRTQAEELVMRELIFTESEPEQQRQDAIRKYLNGLLAADQARLEPETAGIPR